MKKVILTLIVLCFAALSVRSSIADDETEPPRCESKRTWEIAEPPADLPQIIYYEEQGKPKSFEWENVLDWELKTLSSPYDVFIDWHLCDYDRSHFTCEEKLKETLHYRKDSRMGRIRQKISLGILDGLEFEYNFWRRTLTPEDVRKQFFSKVLSSEDTLNTLYEWALPSAKQMFLSLDRSDQIEYMMILRHIKKYVRKYDHNVELNYLRKLKSQGFVDKFIRIGPDGKFNHYRKLETFVFRRVFDGSMRPSRMKVWLRRLEKDIQPLVKSQ